MKKIKRLPRDEQRKVIGFAGKAGAGRTFSPKRLGQLAKRMAEAKDLVEADRLQQEIECGFYGSQPHA
jgi:hypothetical protein